MKLLVAAALFALVCTQTESQGLLDSFSNAFGILNIAKDPCERDATRKFKEAINDFTVRITKRASNYFNGNFIISPTAIWLSMASLAEYADKTVQPELFAALNLLEEKCVREKYYQLALGLENPGQDVRFDHNRALAIDDQVVLNQEWTAFTSSILKYMPIAFEAETFQNVQQTMGLGSAIALNGHSVILDRLEYEGMWSTAFPDGIIEISPFYNDMGQSIGMLPYMKMKNRVRLAHLPLMDAKILELPVGSNGRYSMLFTMGVKNNTVKRIMDLLMSSLIVDMMSALTWSQIPIEVAIPKFSISSGFDARQMLEDIGLSKIFVDPAATRYVSDPSALPCAYLQKVSINVTSSTLAGPKRDSSNILSTFLNLASDAASEIVSVFGRDFIANRPFLFNVIDTKTRVSVVTGVYSYPDPRTY